MAVQDPDIWRSASHANMIAHLAGPFAGGAVESRLPLTASGRVDVARATREPLVLATLTHALETDRLRLAATLDPDGAPTALAPIEFAPYTEAGAAILMHLPGVDPGARTAAPFVLALELHRVAEDGTETAVAADAIADHLAVRLVEGVTGRLVYALGAEKMRIRRQARELAACRLLSTARHDALDRFGADLSVPRFSDQIRFDAARGEIVTLHEDPPGTSLVESDARYRRRLGLYRPLRMPTRARLLHLLNGPGDPGDPNRGPLGDLGFASRFDVVEADNLFGVAIHLVAVGPATTRLNFLDHVRRVHLIWPNDAEPGNGFHDARFLPTSREAVVAALRARLRGSFAFADDHGIAPMLASALDRVGRARQALGVVAALPVLRAQASDGGSRYELGLGADIAPMRAVDLNRMRRALSNPDRAPDPDPAIEALLRSLAPRPAGEDPEGRWLLEACGLRTVHRVADDRLYVSHLPTFGMSITGPSQFDLGLEAQFAVNFNAPLDPGGNVVLVEGLAGVADRWTSAGNPAFTVLTGDGAAARWQAAVATPVAAVPILQAAGLRSVDTPERVVTALNRLPREMLAVLVLNPAQSAEIVGGQDSAREPLGRLVSLLRDHGVSSALPLVTSASEVVLVVGVVGLPEVGLNLSERRASGFRWYAVTLQGSDLVHLRSVGSRGFITPRADGLHAMVAVGYARRGLTDPYEYRVELPDGALLDVEQYEFLMNALDSTFPIGVEINTFSIRRERVDLDGDGRADPLPPSIFRTYRRFVHRRHAGEAAVTVTPEP